MYSSQKRRITIELDGGGSATASFSAEDFILKEGDRVDVISLDPANPAALQKLKKLKKEDSKILALVDDKGHYFCFQNSIYMLFKKRHYASRLLFFSFIAYFATAVFSEEPRLIIIQLSFALFIPAFIASCITNNKRKKKVTDALDSYIGSL